MNGLVVREVGQDALDRDGTREPMLPALLRPEHLRHPADGETLLELVGAELHGGSLAPRAARVNEG